MKRKADSQSNGHNSKDILKKRAKTILSEEEVQKSFRKGLFSKDMLQNYTKSYAESEPYKHSVISSLIDDSILRSVRNEIRENVHFTPKETDIYTIHQSGDLANLDGLDDGALESLPSLLRLRDVLYSSSFRKYVSTITGSGELSGRKTDMAINIYTPGCHLLCHDDVIGSRRVSYILYLTDPDVLWKEEWGGGLRLYPTKSFEEETGETTKTPSPDFSKVIPPAWNQLSFFAVQPGESFHDVEEVYHAATKEEWEKDGGRIRMAISGWYHIPQLGEDGYVKGAEEKWGANSSLMQLQGHPDRYDFPQSNPKIVGEEPEEKEKTFEEADLDFLLKYMAPTYLTPDTLEQVAERFGDECSVTLDGLLSKSFAAKLRKHIESQEASPLPKGRDEIEKGSWKVAKPPHKHRFLYSQPSATPKSKQADEVNPLEELTQVFLSSKQFRQWLEIATRCRIESYDILARRFRRGLDYALATGHDGNARLEIGLGLTPTSGWVADKEEVNVERDGEDNEARTATNGYGEAEEEKPEEKVETKSEEVKANGSNKNPTPEPQEDPDVGGHEVYMAGDEDDPHSDAAIYKTTQGSEDDNVLFTMPASWNKLSIVLRDSGVLKFVKYVSKKAPVDRWDVTGAFDVTVEESEDEDEDEEEGEEGEAEGEQVTLESSEEETVFNGFSNGKDSDSD